MLRLVPFELREPSGLWLFSLVVPLIVLYLLKVRRQRREVSSTFLWLAAERDLLAKTPFRRLVNELPLLFQITLLALLALALSRPASRAGSIEGDHLAIVIDTTASMATREDGGTTRLDLAKEQAEHVLSAMGPGAEALLLEAASEPRLAAPLERDRRRLRAALQALEVRETAGNLADALAVAADRLRALPGKTRIIAITDRRDEDFTTGDVPLELVRVGSERDNLAIVRVDVRGGIDPVTRREEVQAFALIANFGRSPREVSVYLRQQNVSEPLASRRLRLGPGERVPAVLTFEPAPADVGMGLSVELSPRDALPLDDRAFGKVPAPARLPVVLAPAQGSPWVKRALLADPEVEVLTVPSVADLDAARITDEALVIVDGACPARTAGNDLLVLNPPPGACRSVRVGERLERPALTSWSEHDARLRFVSFDEVYPNAARRLELESPSQALLLAREGPVAADISLEGRSGTLVAFDVGESNWPLKASFVVFVRNVVEVARANRAKSVLGPARTGQALRVRVPPAASEVTVVDPRGRELTVPARSGLAVLPDVSVAGFYHLSWRGERPGSVLALANLTEERESNLRATALPSTATPQGNERAHAPLAGVRSFSWLFACAALLVLVLDIVWLTRKRRVVRKERRLA
jgi:hypothetical protein